MADAKLQIVIEAINKAGAELDGIKKQLGGLEQPAKKASMSLTDMWSGFQLVTRGATMALDAVKAVYDAAGEGAKAAQLGASFQGIGGDLTALQAAAGGTIDDMTLMGSTLTLVAGASDELQASMLDAAPQLIEIARAASKLNPSLGDTASMYQSLGLGIKRSSPMILDNLGLTIKIEEANQNYAAALGKTVEELTGAERQQALLNETIRAGSVLIEQAGGSVESQADAWAVMTTNIKNATDAAKVNLAEAVGPTINRMAEWDMVIAKVEDGYTRAQIQQDAFRNSIGMGSQIIEDYNNRLRGAEATASRYAGLAVDWTAKQDDAASAVSDTARAVQQYNDAIANSKAAGEGVAAMIQAQADAAANAASAFDTAAAGLAEMGKAQFAQNLISMYQEALGPGEEFNRIQHEILVTFGLLTPAEEAAQGALVGLVGGYDGTAAGARRAADAAYALNQELDRTKNQGDIMVRIREVRERYVTAEQQLSDFNQWAGGGAQQATGGQFWATDPMRLTVGEGGQPELVTVTPATQVSNTWNVNFQGMNAGGAVSAVRMLQALYGA